VYCTVSFDLTFKKNGKKITHDNVIHRFTFRNGKVIEWRGTDRSSGKLDLSSSSQIVKPARSVSRTWKP
jgi:hypothetical protein